MTISTKQHYVEGFPAVTTVSNDTLGSQDVVVIRVDVKVKGRIYSAKQALSAFALMTSIIPQEQIFEATEAEVIRVVRAAIHEGERTA